ncbi:hypothetical protein Tco_1216866 [Tanacetum coccineum]
MGNAIVTVSHSSEDRTGLLYKPQSIGKGRRYKRRKETKGKKVVSSLDFQEEVVTGAEQVNTAKGVNTGSIKLSQRAGKAPMIIEETPKKSKEQILQEEASLVEAIRLDTLQKEEVAKQVHLDSLLAQRIAEEEELNKQQKKRKAQVQFEAQHYTDGRLGFNTKSLKRFGEELQTKTSKRLKSDEAKDDEPTKKSGKRENRCKERLHKDLIKIWDGMADEELETIFWTYLKICLKNRNKKSRRKQMEIAKNVKNDGTASVIRM